MNYSKETIESLANKAEVLVKGRGYEVENIEKNETGIDIIASVPSSEDKVLIRIITEPYLDSGRVGKQLTVETHEEIEDEEIKKTIILGKSFTAGSKSFMEEEGMEFVPKGESAVTLVDPFKLYPRIQMSVNDLCKSICGKVPKSEKECKGYVPEPRECQTCKGTGSVEREGREVPCPDCRGRGLEASYKCRVRLVSDNADFHFERGWGDLLQNDLKQLIRMQTEQATNQKLAERILEIQEET